MKENKLLTLLNRFTKKELKRFGDLVDSPFFNKSQLCKQLLSLLLEQLTTSGSLEIHKEDLFRKLFPDKENYNSSLSVVLSQLTRLAEEFLVQDRLNDRQSYKKQLLLEGLQEKEQWAYFEQEYSATIKQQERTLHRGPAYFYEKFLLSKTNWEYSLENKKGDKTFTPTALTKNLDEFYLSYRLLFAYAANLRVEYDTAQLTKVMALAEAADLLKNPIIKLFYTAILLLKEKEKPSHFKNFMQLLDVHHRIIPRKELSELFTVAANYCIRKINVGQPDFKRKSLDVYKKAIAYNGLFSSQYISDQRVKNIVSLALQVGEAEWASQFLEGQIQSVSPKMRQGVYCFNRAAIFYYSGAYQQAMVFLNQMEKINTVYERNRKFILLKIFYLLEEDQLLFNQAKSFKEFLRTNKAIKQNEVKKSTNATKILLGMAKLRFNPTRKGVEKLEGQLAGFELVSSEAWLVEMLGLLRGRVS